MQIQAAYNLLTYSKAMFRKKIVFLFILVIFCQAGQSQIIKGFVKDYESGNAISFASVYINGSYIGTNTDQNGYFELNIPENMSMPLTISALGYYSTTVSEYSKGNQVLIYLQTRTYELKEVVVRSKALSHNRSQYLNLFRKEFLGTNMGGYKCRILNEDDILFSYDSDRGIFTAFSSKPIIIDNSYLGYRIMYFLDKFEFSYPENGGDIKGLILGNYKFLEAPVVSSKEQEKYERRRKITYMGSRMHFFRELWSDRLDSTGFEIRDSSINKVYCKDIVFPHDGTAGQDNPKYLKFKGKLYISFYTRSITSSITMTRDTVYFSKNGYFDPVGLSWEGEMSDQRIGDLLPFEYKIK
jgi:hypothetical protein